MRRFCMVLSCVMTVIACVGAAVEFRDCGVYAACAIAYAILSKH